MCASQASRASRAAERLAHARTREAFATVLLCTATVLLGATWYGVSAQCAVSQSCLALGSTVRRNPNLLPMRSKYAQLINISSPNGFATVSRAPGRARRLQRGAKFGRKKNRVRTFAVLGTFRKTPGNKSKYNAQLMEKRYCKMQRW